MKKKYIPFMIVLVLLLVGLWFDLRSPLLGSDSANEYLRAHGGNMDTGQFNIILQSYIDAYRQLGGILFGAGVVGIAIFSCKRKTI